MAGCCGSGRRGSQGSKPVRKTRSRTKGKGRSRSRTTSQNTASRRTAKSRSKPRRSSSRRRSSRSSSSSSTTTTSSSSPSPSSSSTSSSSPPSSSSPSAPSTSSSALSPSLASASSSRSSSSPQSVSEIVIEESSDPPAKRRKRPSTRKRERKGKGRRRGKRARKQRKHKGKRTRGERSRRRPTYESDGTYASLEKAPPEVRSAFLSTLSDWYNLALAGDSMDQLDDCEQIEVDWVEYLTQRLAAQFAPASAGDEGSESGTSVAGFGWLGVYDVVAFLGTSAPDTVEQLTAMELWRNRFVSIPVTGPGGGHYSHLLVTTDGEGAVAAVDSLDTYKTHPHTYLNDAHASKILNGIAATGIVGTFPPALRAKLSAGVTDGSASSPLLAIHARPDLVRQSSSSQNCGFFVCLGRQLCLEILAFVNDAGEPDIPPSVLRNMFTSHIHTITRAAAATARAELKADLGAQFAAWLAAGSPPPRPPAVVAGTQDGTDWHWDCAPPSFTPLLADLSL